LYVTNSFIYQFLQFIAYVSFSHVHFGAINFLQEALWNEKLAPEVGAKFMESTSGTASNTYDMELAAVSCPVLAIIAGFA